MRAATLAAKVVMLSNFVQHVFLSLSLSLSLLLYVQKVRCMIDDVRMDVDEIREHVKRFGAASIA